jgi:two-component system response regulator PilR (NtrC family)
MKNTVLIIDDEPDICDILSQYLDTIGVPCITAENMAQAIVMLEEPKVGLVLTDLRLPDGDGLDIVKLVAEKYPKLPIAVFSGHGNVETAVEALKMGAFDFVNKPVKMNDLVKMVEHALVVVDAPEEVMEDPLQKLLGESPQMLQVKKLIRKVARSQAPVYVSGPSGSGKELVARLIHDCGPRTDGPFVAINCGAIPAELMESEFFGHKKGSFTGAHSDKQGLFEAADGGSLFLDEVADLPLAMQVKLLRAIQEKAVRPVGSTQEIGIDARILSATHAALEQRVAEGQFREDLFYRLNVIQLTIPSLAERREDIPLLAEHLLKRINTEEGVSISDAAMQALMSHDFGGNIRELENTLERATALMDGNVIEVEDLALISRTTADDSEAPTFTPGDAPITEYLEHVEKEALVDALEKTRGNKTDAAKLLGISFRTIRYKLEKFGLK